MKPIHHLLLVLLLTTSLCSAYAAELADFVRPAPLVDIQISPDGQHLALLRREAKDTLYIVKRADNSIVTGVSSSPGQRFHDYHWANNSRLLIEPAVVLSSYDHPLPTGAILGFSLNGEKNGFLRRSKTADSVQMFRLINVLSDDPDHVLVARHPFAAADVEPSLYVRAPNALGLTTAVIAAQKIDQGYRQSDCGDGCELDKSLRPTLEKLNIYTGKSEVMLTAPSARGEFIASGDAQQFMFTGLDSGIVSIYRAEASEWQEIKYFTQYYDLGATPIGFDASNGIMALDNLVDTLGVSRLDDRGEVNSLFRDTVADIDTLVHSRDGTFMAASFSAGFPSWYYHAPDSAFAQTHKALRAAYPDSDIAVTSFTDNEREAVVRVYSDKNPGTFYVVNLETREAEDLLRQIDWLENNELVATRPVQIPTRDKFEIYGYLTLPKSDKDSPPVIVMTQKHPFSGRFQWGYDAKAQMFANAGFAVLQINTRGAPGYGHRYTTGSDVELDRWTDNDIVDAVGWAGRQELIDPSKVCLFGTGRGAYSALFTAIRNPGKFRCVVAADGRYELEELEDTSNPARLFPAALLRQRDAEELPWFDNLADRADMLATPTLIVSENELPSTRALLEKSRATFAQHVIGVTNLNRVNRTDELIATYERILEFVRGSFAADLPGTRDFDKALHELLNDEERQKLKEILDRIYRDIQRATRERDPRDLPSGFQRRAGDPQEKLRRARNAIERRDKDVKKVLPEDYWPAYEKLKQNYTYQVQESIERGKDLPRYVLPGSAGR